MLYIRIESLQRCHISVVLILVEMYFCTKTICVAKPYLVVVSVPSSGVVTDSVFITYIQHNSNFNWCNIVHPDKYHSSGQSIHTSQIIPTKNLIVKQANENTPIAISHLEIGNPCCSFLFIIRPPYFMHRTSFGEYPILVTILHTASCKVANNGQQ